MSLYNMFPLAAHCLASEALLKINISNTARYVL